jgi:hypothetical protein
VKVVHVLPDFLNRSNKLVSDLHGDRNGLLRPGVPVVDVHIRPANRRFMDFDQDVVEADFRHRNVFQPDTGSGCGFDECLHSYGYR